MNMTGMEMKRMQSESRVLTLIERKDWESTEEVKQFPSIQTSQLLCGYRFYFLLGEILLL